MSLKFLKKAPQAKVGVDGRRYRSKSESRRMRPRQQAGRSRAFWVLLVFLVLVFLMGGSSRKEIPTLILLRPISVLVAFYAMATTSLAQWRMYRAPIVMLAAIVALVTAHLVPLPPAIWHGLAGRDIILDIQRLAGQPDIWLPLSMVPGATLNALYALFTPIAVFFLAIQLSDRDNFWLLVALTALGLLSGLVGILQAAGINIRLYTIMSDTPPGLLANRNHQAALLAMLFPMLALIASVGERYELDRHLLRLIAVALAIALIPLVLVTGSRMGLVVTALAIVLVAALRLELLPPGLLARSGKGKWIAAGALALLVALFGLALSTSTRNVAVSRLSLVDEDLRYSVWEQVWALLPSYFPWGSGIGSYVEVYQIHEPANLLITSYSNHAHNDWLEVIMTAGVPGLVLLAIAVIMFATAAWRSAGTRGTQGKFNRLGLLMILVLAIASIADYPLRTPIMAAVFAVATMWSCRPNHALREVEGREANV
jgi:O-antigen ligase